MTTAPEARHRPLRRTLSPSRWGDYRRFLVAALAHGYQIVSLEDYVASPRLDQRRTLVLRHDVDQVPRSALRIARIELRLGVRSTLYFRWRTASPRIIRWLRDRGFSVGFHYETLSRMALSANGDWSDADALPEAREILKAEIAAFVARYGPIRTVSYHGDSRVAAENRLLLRKQDIGAYGLEFDGNHVMRERELGYWLTDRPGGRWGGDTEPGELFDRGVTPILCLAHPNNWVSGATVWRDRLVRLPLRWVRTGGRATEYGRGVDRPPL